VNRHGFIDRFALPYHREVFGEAVVCSSRTMRR
jgi:hypothetical protein